MVFNLKERKLIKMKKCLAIIFIIVIIVGTLTACDMNTIINSESKNDQNTSENGQMSDSKDIVNSNLQLEKIGELDVDFPMMVSSGIYHRDESGKYAITTLDGKNSTEAKYAHVENLGHGYFETSELDMNVSSIATINIFGVVDENAKEILPAEYALVEALSDRYIYVAKVTDFTDSKDECLIYLQKNGELISMNGSDDGDILLKGEWYIYDVVKGQRVKGATGTQPCSARAYGNYIHYMTEEGKYITIDDSGQKTPENITVSPDGSYSVSDEDSITCYDGDGKKLISVKKEDYTSVYIEGDYFCAYRSVDGTSEYVLLDKSGKEISTVFNKNIEVYGHMIECDDYIYDFDGKKLIDKKYTSIAFDVTTQNYLLYNAGKDETLVDKEGNIIYSISDSNSENIAADISNFLFYERAEANRVIYYSLKSKDFIFEGHSVAPWIVKVSNDDKSEKLVSVISDETLLDGYKDYISVKDKNSKIYIYATRLDGSGKDIYILK